MLSASYRTTPSADYGRTRPATRVREFDSPRTRSRCLNGSRNSRYDSDRERRHCLVSDSNEPSAQDDKWRNPELEEVIEYLNSASDVVKANAAAYLQHLCYRDDAIKSKTRQLNGIPVLVRMVLHPLPEVHRSACGALRNLSCGHKNTDNKRAIVDAGGISVLVNLLRVTADSDVLDIVSGILWNLSSCAALKWPIIDGAVRDVVERILEPQCDRRRQLAAEFRRHGQQPTDVSWSPALRNVLGVLRNVSSAGDYARKQLRQCPCLVESVISIVQTAIDRNDIDNKFVENCVCILRNLSYACQEIDDPLYIIRRSQLAETKPSCQQRERKATGCFSKKKRAEAQANSSPCTTRRRSPTQSDYGPAAMLWQPEVVRLYMPIIIGCSNPQTLESAVGAIQNLAACDWQPSVDIRAAVRREKMLPVIVDLLNLDVDCVVRVTATTLRNLALDPANKQLIAKHALHLLIARLPPAVVASVGTRLPDDTVAAILATVFEIVKFDANYARAAMEGGLIERLMGIVKRTTPQQHNGRVYRFTAQLLIKLWSFSELHDDYKKQGWKHADFHVKPASASASPTLGRDYIINDNTLTLTRSPMDQSGPVIPGCNDHTVYITRPVYQQSDAIIGDPQRDPVRSSTLCKDEGYYRNVHDNSTAGMNTQQDIHYSTESDPQQTAPDPQDSYKRRPIVARIEESYDADPGRSARNVPVPVHSPYQVRDPAHSPYQVRDLNPATNSYSLPADRTNSYSRPRNDATVTHSHNRYRSYEDCRQPANARSPEQDPCAADYSMWYVPRQNRQNAEYATVKKTVKYVDQQQPTRTLNRSWV